MKNKKTVAELQAARKLLEQDVAVLGAKTDAASKAEVKAANAGIESIDLQLERNDRDAADMKVLEAKADEAVDAMIASGSIPPQDAARKASYRQAFIDQPQSIELHAGAALKAKASKELGGRGGVAAGSVAGRITPVAGAVSAVNTAIQGFAVEAGASYNYDMAAAGWSAKEALSGYAEIQNINTNAGWNATDPIALQIKSERAIEAGNWYNKHLKPHVKDWENIPGWQVHKMVLQSNAKSQHEYLRALQAGDYTSGTLGTLSGTLVLQRCLPNFAYDYPELLALYTDFSDTPGLYNQTETTRIVVQAAVQTYNPALTGGYPSGFSANADGTGTTVDSSITLTDYIGVPIVIGNNVLASTTRRLFDEQAYLAVKGIAGYFTGMMTNLLTQQNYNAYATATANFASGGVTYGGSVPNPYPTYPVSSGTFALSDLDKISAAFSSLKIPKADRGILLNPTFYAKLRSDPRFYFLYAAAAKSIASPSDYLSEPLLPRVSGFAPYEAPYLPTATPSQVTTQLPNPVATTANVAGFAFHKASIMLKSRLPQDFTQAIGAMVPGSVTTITDPDTKISIMLVQYVDLIKNYATWRPEIILGAAVADFRGGLVLTGQ